MATLKREGENSLADENLGVLSLALSFVCSQKLLTAGFRREA
jgi:hypothetical protein